MSVFHRSEYATVAGLCHSGSRWAGGPDPTREEGICVARVFLQDEQGDKIVVVASGYDAEGAVANALEWANGTYRVGGSYAMDEYEPA